MNLTLDERTKIFDKVCRLVETKHFNPAMNGADWNALVRSRRDQIIACERSRSIREGSQPVGRRTQDQPHRIPARRDAKYTSASCDQCDSASPRDERHRALDVSGCAPRRPGLLGWDTAWRFVARNGRARDSASRGAEFFRRRISAAHRPKTGRRSSGSHPSVAHAQVQEASSNRA